MHRPAARRRKLSQHPQHHLGRRDHRRRRDPSRLRLPVRERPLRRDRRAHDIIFIGPKPEHIRTMGDKVEAKRTAGALGLPLVPGSDGAISDLVEAKEIADEDRLSGDHQGGVGRRRARHEGRDQRGPARNADAAGRHRGQGRVRRRHRLYREISRQSAPHRVPDVRRRQGQCHPSRRARLLAPAPPPEGARGGALPGHHRRGARADGRDRRQGDGRHGLSRRRARSSSCGKTASSTSSR